MVDAVQLHCCCHWHVGAGVEYFRVFCWEFCQEHWDLTMVEKRDMEAPKLLESPPIKANMVHHGPPLVNTYAQPYHTS